MRSPLFVFACVALATPALAAQPPAQPDLVLLPRAAAEAALHDAQAIATLHPDLATPVVQDAFSAIAACLADNPQNGRLVRMGPDRCPVVTAELAKRDKELADLRKQAADANAAAEKAKKAADAAKAKEAEAVQRLAEIRAEAKRAQAKAAPMPAKPLPAQH